MNIFSLLFAEMSKLAANKTILFSVIAALLVPVVYGGILLSATWGPYDNLSNLPVAVVNNDQGAISDDEPINVGNQLVAKLKEGNGLGWKFVNTTEAMKGLQNNELYMVIVIPEDFSQRAATVLDKDPKKLELEYIQNEGLNFLASQVTKSATEKIREQLANTITETYAATVFSGLEEVAEGFEKAADGSEKLADGTTQLHDGTNQLNESVTEKMADISKLADGTKQLKEGTGLLLSSLQGKSGDISRLASGSQELHAGTVRLKDGTAQILAGLQKAEPGSKKIRDGLYNRLIPGSAAVAEGSAAVQNGSAQLAAGAKELVAGLEEYRNANPTVRVGPYYQQIIDGAKKISNGLDTLSSKSVGLTAGANKIANGLADSVGPGIVSLNDGINKLVAGQTRIVDGATQLEAGAKQIADGNAKVNTGWADLTKGVTSLDAGAAKIYDGNKAVNQGWKTLAAGTSKLNDGAKKVNNGSKELATGLKAGAEKTGDLNTGKENIEMFASPVELKSEKINEYEHYRDSTAPYVLTLGLFVGILIMSLFIDFKKPQYVSTFSWFAVKFTKLACLAIAQGILLLVVILILLNLNVSNPFGLVLFTLIVSLAFSAIVLFLAAIGGNIGRFIALAFVVLQLSTTGANLPIQMLPENLRNLSDYLPFTYSIAGFKSVISLNDFGGVLINMGVLLGYLAIFALLTFAVYFFKNRNFNQNREREIIV
jgi:putative membrane protein